MDILTTTWLIRYGHVMGGGIWVGGYALLALVVIPLLSKDAPPLLVKLTTNAVRLLTYAGVGTIGFGLLLITRTRGYATIWRGGEWGGIIILCVVIAIALLGIGDGMLRPGIRHLVATGDGRRARRAAWLGLLLTVLAVGFMTRALYAVS